MACDDYTKKFFSMNLQFFAEGEGGEKTEDATSKKLDKAREEGQVAKSNELVMAVSILTLFLTVKIFIGYIKNSFLDIFVQNFGYISKYVNGDFSSQIGLSIAGDILWAIVKTAFPFYIAAFCSAIIVNISQFKWKVTNKPLKPKFDRLSPIKGLKRMFSKDKIVELIKAILKILAISYVIYSTLKGDMDALLNLYDYTLWESIELVGDLVIQIGIEISALLMFIGFVDLFYQKKKFKKDMKMTKQEIKEEVKESEGDPQIKGKIRRKMMEASASRMMQQVPQADVVITNPTHISVALKYDKNTKSAPVVVAKGEEFLAFKIKEVAKENGIIIYENKPLARMIYYNVDLGQEIPPELYQMVAEVLAYVYKEREAAQ